MPDTTGPPSPPAQPPGELERRQVDRSPPPSPRVVGRARLLPGDRWHSPGFLPDTWYPVLDRNPAVTTLPLAGWMWVELYGRPRNVWAAHFEVQIGAPTPYEEYGR
jgi:hypothetical protein